jgi:hypothetical protein
MKWNFINVYGAAQEEDKDNFLIELAEFISKSKEPLVLGGDFNIIRYSSEKNKGGVHKHTGTFNAIINTYELIDLKMSGGSYTWSNNKKNPTLERLDRYLVSKIWENMFPLAYVFRLPRELSDHNQIILSLPSKHNLKKLAFRFEISWLKNPDFQPKVKEIWEKTYYNMSAFDRIQNKLKSFKKIFQGLGIHYARSKQKTEGPIKRRTAQS